MVWSSIELIFSPIVWLMQHILTLYVSLTSSVGLSIILLSLTMIVLIHPLRKKAQALEARVTEKSKQASDEVRGLSKELKGEKRFLEIEKIYEAHGYHPIHDIGQGASFFVMLPILVSAIYLFSGSPTVAGQSFLFVPDLSKPDGILGPVNFLPLLMSGITIADARIRFREDKAARYKFYAIALVLFVLVYNLPSALVLYWTASNAFAFATIWFTRDRYASSS